MNNNSAARIVTPSPRPAAPVVPDGIGSTSSSRPNSPPRYSIGQRIRKFFASPGKVFEGVITIVPADGSPYYRVYYPEDSDEEDIHQDKIDEYIVAR